MTPRFLAQTTRRMELASTKGRGQEKLVCRTPSEAQLETILSLGCLLDMSSRQVDGYTVLEVRGQVLTRDRIGSH